ncbi:unnamed protein product [Rotaria socialis]
MKLSHSGYVKKRVYIIAESGVPCLYIIIPKERKKQSNSRVLFGASIKESRIDQEKHSKLIYESSFQCATFWLITYSILANIAQTVVYQSTLLRLKNEYIIMSFLPLLFVVLIALFEPISSVPAYEQCAGLGWDGIFRRCDDGLVCYARSEYYANCRQPNQCPSSWACTVVDSASTKVPPPKIIPVNGQCDNTSYTMCTSGTLCLQQTNTHSECRTQCPPSWLCDSGVLSEYQQCGGDGYTGSTKCAPGLRCYSHSKWYAHCAATCPGIGWMCESG